MTRTDRKPLHRTLTLLGLFCLLPVVGTVLAIGCSPGAGVAAGGAVSIDTSAVSVTIIPKVTTVVAGNTLLFRASGVSPTGTLIAPSVTYSATGGTISVIGLFTAPPTAGIVKVIATKTGGTIADTATVTVTASAIDSTPVSLSITPKTTTLAPGGTRTFTTTGLTSGGVLVLPAVTYSTTGGSVSATGVYTAPVAPGTFKVVAAQTAGSLRDTATVTVAVVGPVTASLVEDFSTYTSTANLHADPRNIYDPEEFGGPWGQWGLITLDTTTGINDIGVGTSTKSMKYTWPDRTLATGVQPDGPRCGDFYMKKGIAIPPVTELWAEFYVKFSANWTSKAPAAWACASNPDYKFIFLATLPGGRFDLKNDYAGLGTRWDANYPGGGEGNANFVANVFHDAQWHRIRIHSKVSLAGANGIHEIWLDGTLVSTRTTLVTTTLAGVAQVSIYGIKLGNNINQGPGQVQTLHWGLIRLFTANPGW